MTPPTRDPDSTAPPSDGAYQVFILLLSLLALLALGIGALLPRGSDVRQILEYADYVVCALFFADFLYQLARAPNRWRYFATWGWIDLLSSVPAVDALRMGRAARILRVLRVLRAAKSVKVLATFILQRRAQSAFLATALLTLLLIVFASIAVLQFEAKRGGNITSAVDAFWWTIVTMTTVGYGDLYPVTPEGRLVAMVLMVAGIGLFGTFSGFVASWFLKPAEREQDGDIERIHEELRAMRKALEALEARRPPAG